MVWKGGLQTAGRAPRSPGALTWIPSSVPHLAWDSRKVSLFFIKEKKYVPVGVSYISVARIGPNGPKPISSKWEDHYG